MYWIEHQIPTVISLLIDSCKENKLENMEQHLNSEQFMKTLADHELVDHLNEHYVGDTIESKIRRYPLDTKVFARDNEGEWQEVCDYECEQGVIYPSFEVIDEFDMGCKEVAGLLFFLFEVDVYGSKLEVNVEGGGKTLPVSVIEERENGIYLIA